MDYIPARCLICGKTYDVPEDHKDYKKIVEKGKASTFICDMCNKKVRHESDEKRKPKKPM